jgi:hypothetical protein
MKQILKYNMLNIKSKTGFYGSHFDSFFPTSTSPISGAYGEAVYPGME